MRQVAITDVLAQVPAGEPVSSPPAYWPYLAERAELYSYPAPFDAGRRVPWVVLETDSPLRVTSPLPPGCSVAVQLDLIQLLRCAP